MRVDLNKHESVTVTLRSKGGGQIWIKSYGKRSPMAVVVSVFLSTKFDKEHAVALRDHAINSGTACSSSRTYRELISWPG